MFARSEVDLILWSGKTGLAREGICHDERQLLLVQPHLLARLRNAERSFHNNNEQLAAAGLHAHRVSGDHAGGVDEFHGLLTRSSPKTGEGSVELHRPALDAIHAGGTAQEIGTLDQYLARLCQRDARLATAQDDLLLGRHDETLSVRIDLDLPSLLRHAPSTFIA